MHDESLGGGGLFASRFPNDDARGPLTPAALVHTATGGGRLAAGSPTEVPHAGAR